MTAMKQPAGQRRSSNVVMRSIVRRSPICAARRQSRAGLYPSRRPDAGARHRRGHDDVQRDPQRAVRSVSVPRCASRGHGSDSRRQQRPSGRPQLLPDAGVSRLPGAKHGVRGGHRRNLRGRPPREQRRDRAIRRRQRLGKHVRVSGCAAGDWAGLAAGRCQARRATSVRDGLQDVAQPFQPGSGHRWPHLCAQRRRDNVGRRSCPKRFTKLAADLYRPDRPRPRQCGAQRQRISCFKRGSNRA